MDTTHIPDQEGSDSFLKLVDFKWLMAGVGWWVDLTRLQRETAYANECLQFALRSDSELLRRHSVELLRPRLNSDAHSDTTAIPSRPRPSEVPGAVHASTA